MLVKHCIEYCSHMDRTVTGKVYMIKSEDTWAISKWTFLLGGTGHVHSVLCGEDGGRYSAGLSSYSPASLSGLKNQLCASAGPGISTQHLHPAGLWLCRALIVHPTVRLWPGHGKKDAVARGKQYLVANPFGVSAIYARSLDWVLICGVTSNICSNLVSIMSKNCMQ